KGRLRSAPLVLGRALQDDPQIGVPPRLLGGDPKPELRAAAEGLDHTRMVQVVSGDHPIEVADDATMARTGDFGHFKDSSPELETIALLLVGVAKLLDRQSAALVGGTEPKFR